MQYIDIYTDGSAEKRTGGRLGCGAFCLYGDREYTMSVACTREVLDCYGISPTQQCSNPTAEFIAFVEVLKLLKNTHANHHLKFHIDYNGIEKWTTGAWKAKEPHIRAVLDEYKRLITVMKCKVSVHWVRAHSGIYGNESADKQAGMYSTDTTQFQELARVLL